MLFLQIMFKANSSSFPSRIDDLEKKRIGMFDRRESADIGKGVLPLSSYCYEPNNSFTNLISRSFHLLLSFEKRTSYYTYFINTSKILQSDRERLSSRYEHVAENRTWKLKTVLKLRCVILFRRAYTNLKCER